MSNKDIYLSYLLGDYTGELPTPITRQDFYLASACGVYTGELPEPLTRTEMLLKEYIEQGGGGGGDVRLIEKLITVNGTYSARSDGADGYKKVTVDVSGAPTLAEKTITTNGEYDPADDGADGYSHVSVAVPSQGGDRIGQAAVSMDGYSAVVGIANFAVIAVAETIIGIGTISEV